MPAPALLVGTHTFAAQVEAARRQATGVSSLAALSGVEVVNLQFESDPHHSAGVETLASLRASSLSVTGRKGVRKPIMSEMFEVLAATAEARGIGWFCFTNADIIFTQAAIEWILGVPGEAAVLSREDFDPTGREAPKMELAGTDVFAVETRWWKSHRHLFRGYIAGDGGWDNVYTAVLLCHARGVIENRRPLIRHERHRRGPMISAPFGEYTRLLGALDALYFGLWCRYWDGLTHLRASGASDEEEKALARSVFVWQPSGRDRAVQFGRAARARLRYEVWRRTNPSHHGTGSTA